MQPMSATEIDALVKRLAQEAAAIDPQFAWAKLQLTLTAQRGLTGKQRSALQNTVWAARREILAAAKRPKPGRRRARLPKKLPVEAPA